VKTYSYSISHNPPQLSHYFKFFNHHLSKPQQLLFQTWITGNLHGFSHGSKIARFHSTKHASSLTRFLSSSKWDEVHLNEQRILQAKQIVDQYFGKYVPLILDDSFVEKFGNHLPGSDYHWDHSQKKTVWGQQLVTSHLVLDSVDLPLFADVYLKEHQIANLKQNDYYTEFQSKIELAIGQIERFPRLYGKTGVVLADSWYNSKELINKALDRGFHAIIGMKNNRKLKLKDESRSLKLGSLIKELDEESSHLVTVGENTYRTWRYSAKLSGIDQEWVTVLICQKLGFETDEDGNQKAKWSDHITLMATDEEMSEYTILKLYEKRWKIEVFYKFSKESLGMEKSQTRRVRTLLRFLILLFFSYTFLALSLYYGSTLDMNASSFYDAQAKFIERSREQLMIWCYHQGVLGTTLNEFRLKISFR
jgi:hypothetical protein